MKDNQGGTEKTEINYLGLIGSPVGATNMAEFKRVRNSSAKRNDFVFHPAIHSFWKEGNVLFNDALNTFYLRLYGVRHMVKHHSDSERGNLLPPHGLLFPISSKGSFICIIPQTYHGLCYTSRGALAGMRISSMGPPHEGSIRRPITP